LQVVPDAGQQCAPTHNLSFVPLIDRLISRQGGVQSADSASVLSAVVMYASCDADIWGSGSVPSNQYQHTPGLLDTQACCLASVLSAACFLLLSCGAVWLLSGASRPMHASCGPQTLKLFAPQTSCCWVVQAGSGPACKPCTIPTCCGLAAKSH
jgi:hypothetical protein